MKKVSLKKLSFETNEILDNDQLKTILGGVNDSHAPEPSDHTPGGGGGSVAVVCNNGASTWAYSCNSSTASSFCAPRGGIYQCYT